MSFPFNISPNDLINWRGFKAIKWNLPPKKPGVYGLIHIETGRAYIGLASYMSDRFSKHGAGESGPKIRNAIQKYGRNAFLAVPLYFPIRGTDSLLDVEASLIQAFDSVKHGFNIAERGRTAGPYGPEFSESLKRAFADPELKKRRGAAIKLSHKQPHVIEAKRKNLLDIYADPERRAARLTAIANGQAQPKVKERRREWLHILHTDPKINARRIAGLREACNTEEARALKREIWARIFADPDVRQKRDEGHKRSWANPEKRPKRLAILKKTMSDPNMIARRNASIRAAFSDPETKARRNAAIKAAFERRGPVKWINDGIANRRIPVADEIPIGWRLGKKPRSGHL